MGVITTIPCGSRAPLTFADFVFTRPCKACDGEGSERYIDGPHLRTCRENAKWSLRRMARELGLPPTSLSAMEREQRDFDEDTARRYLAALGLI